MDQSLFVYNVFSVKFSLCFVYEAVLGTYYYSSNPCISLNNITPNMHLLLVQFHHFFFGMFTYRKVFVRFRLDHYFISAVLRPLKEFVPIFRPAQAYNDILNKKIKLCLLSLSDSVFYVC